MLLNQITNDNINKGKINKYFNYHYLYNPIYTVKLLFQSCLNDDINTLTYINIILNILVSFNKITNISIIDIFTEVLDEYLNNDDNNELHIKCGLIIFKAFIK